MDTARMEAGKFSTTVSMHHNRLTMATNVAMKNMKTPWVDSSVADLRILTAIRAI